MGDSQSSNPLTTTLSLRGRKQPSFRRGDFQASKLLTTTTWSLYENKSKIMLNQPYTEGVISLLEKHVHPQFSSPHSDAVRGGSIVISAFLLSDRHLRCCFTPSHVSNSFIFMNCGEEKHHVTIARNEQPSSGRPKSPPSILDEHVGSPLQIWMIGNHPYDFKRGKPRPYNSITPPFVKGGREGFNNNHNKTRFL